MAVGGVMKSVDDVMKSVNRVYGKRTVSVGVLVKDVLRLPTGIFSLDEILQGGLPFGRAIEIYGEEGSGKSSTSLIVIASAQKLYPDRKCVYVDAEGTYDPVYGAMFGINNDELIYSSPENMSAEQCYDMVTDFIDTGECSVVVLDSIPSLESGQEEDKDISGTTMAPIAGPLSKFCKKLQKALLRNRDKTLYIGLNQLRDNFSQYGAPTLTPGGRAWKHTCSIRLECKAVPLDENGKELGRKVDNPYATQITLCKIKDKTANKMGRKKLASFVISDQGVDLIWDLYNAAVSKGIIKTAGSKVMLVSLETSEIIHSEIGKDKFRKSLTDEHINYLKSVIGDPSKTEE